MKAKWKCERYEIEAEGAGSVEVFDELSSLIEILANTRCGACDSEEVIPRLRESGDYKFRELLCRSCGCTLGLGQKRSDGSLFPKRNDRDGKRLENGGWVKWQPREGSDSPVIKSKADVPF